jgi:NAD(P)-dependent dehydrogenase (short-subunit alcohol dehydrogenase family)
MKVWINGCLLLLVSDVYCVSNQEEQVALVTGASGDIGEKIVDSLIKDGKYVIVHYNLNKKKAIELEKKHKGKCIAISADFSNPMNAVQLWEKSLSQKGRIDFLINNAGILEFVSCKDTDNIWNRSWMNTLNINLVAASLLCKKAIEHFIAKKKQGVIVNISSRTANNGYPFNGMHYAASKAGIIALNKSIAATYSKEKILSYVISPGCVNTKMLRSIKGEILIGLKNEIPTGEFVTPQEIANLVVFLCSACIRNATGCSFDINGASYLR